jgi:hypothetical protein
MKLEDHPLSVVRDCLFNTFAATLNISCLLHPQPENVRGDTFNMRQFGFFTATKVQSVVFWSALRHRIVTHRTTTSYRLTWFQIISYLLLRYIYYHSSNVYRFVFNNIYLSFYIFLPPPPIIDVIYCPVVFNISNLTFLNAVSQCFDCFLRGPVYSRHYACAVLLYGKWRALNYLLRIEECVSYKGDDKICAEGVFISIYKLKDDC